VKTLNRVLPYDWRGFWNERLHRLGSAPPVDGLTASGWKLEFSGEESPEQKGQAAMNKRTSLEYSLGFAVNEDGASVSRLIPGSPADVAGVMPGGHLIAVNGRKYSKDVLMDALKEGGEGTRRIGLLLLDQDTFYDTFELSYAGHGRYPHLERATAPDLLSAIMAPRSP
jgi:hypothetical protein